MKEYIKNIGESGDLIIYVQNCTDFEYEEQKDLGSYEKKQLSRIMYNMQNKECLRKNERLQEIVNYINIKP